MVFSEKNRTVSTYCRATYSLSPRDLTWNFVFLHRTTTTPVVGWPPIRSFRKNIAYTSKPFPEPQNESSKIVTKIESKEKGLFVKINMDGIPIGRKVDLKAYDSYEKLSLAVDELFRGLLAGIQCDID